MFVIKVVIPFLGVASSTKRQYLDLFISVINAGIGFMLSFVSVSVLISSSYKELQYISQYLFLLPVC